MMTNEELYDQVVQLKKKMGSVSAAFLQFKLRISHAKAVSLLKAVANE